jgi:hypothetical protein
MVRNTTLSAGDENGNQASCNGDDDPKAGFNEDGLNKPAIVLTGENGATEEHAVKLKVGNKRGADAPLPI